MVVLPPTWLLLFSLSSSFIAIERRRLQLKPQLRREERRRRASSLQYGGLFPSLLFLPSSSTNQRLLRGRRERGEEKAPSGHERGGQGSKGPQKRFPLSSCALPSHPDVSSPSGFLLSLQREKEEAEAVEGPFVLSSSAASLHQQQSGEGEE